MRDALIGAAATVLAAILSAVISRQGWEFWRQAASIKCSGVARELQAIRDGCTEAAAENETQYQLRDGQISIRGSRVSFSAHVTVVDAGVALSTGRLRATGRFYNGYAYLLYLVEDSDRNQSWPGLCLIRVPGLGDLTGYWITEDNVRGGVIAFGDVKLSRG